MPSYKNQAGLSEEHLTLLEADLGQLAALAPDLPGQFLRFVVDGEGEECLERLATTPRRLGPCEPCPSIIIPQPAAPQKEPRVRFFARPATQDPRFYLQLVRAYQAIWRHDCVSTTPMGWASLAEASWLEPFLFELNTLRDKASEFHLPAPAGMTIPLLEGMLAADGKPADLLTRALLIECGQKGSNDLLECLLVPIPGLGQSLAERSKELIAWLKKANARARVRLLELLAKVQAPVYPFLNTVAQLAIGPSQVVREAAARVLEAVPEAAAEQLKQMAAEADGDQRTEVMRLLDRLLNAGSCATAAEQEEAPAPVESLRGLEDGIFSKGGKIMAVCAPFDDVHRVMVEAMQRNGAVPGGIWLVQLRGHRWTVVSSDEPLDDGVLSEEGAERVSRDLAAEVVFCLSEDTSGMIVGCIFRNGEPLLKMDNLNGIAHRSTAYGLPHQGVDEESDEAQFDVVRHLHQYLLRPEGTYLPSIWPKVPPGTGVGVIVRGLKDADFERVVHFAGTSDAKEM